MLAVAAAELDGRPVVISGGGDRTVRVWDLATGAPVGDPFTGHGGWVRSVAAAELDGRPVVISGSDDETVRVWDLATGAPVGDPFTGHGDWVRAVAAAELDGRPVVISGSDDRTVRVWDLATGAPVGDPFTGHGGWVRCGGGRRSWTAARWSSPAATTGRCGCGTWPPAPRSAARSPATAGTVLAVAAAELEGRPVVISGSSDETVRVWDLATGAPVGDPFTGHGGWVTAVAAAELDGRPVVISGGSDGTVRVWDLATGDPGRRPVHRPPRFGERGGGGRAGRPPGGHLRQQRRDGAGVGPGHRRPGRRPVHRPRRRGAVGGGRGAGGPPSGHLRRRATGRCGCGTWPPGPRSAPRSPATAAR